MPMLRFTQYLRPNGRRVPVEIDVPNELYEVAQRFILLGGVFECEQLRTGHVSLTAVMDGDDRAIEVVNNNAEVPPAVHRLVIKADKYLKERIRADARDDKG